MQAVLIGASEEVVEERRRLGLDKKDELWDGEWHLVNPPKIWHEHLNMDLFLALVPLARRAGLVPYGATTGVFGDVERNWRVPDQTYARPEDAMEEGLLSAELVVEVRSPGDESFKKLPFYASRGVNEVLIVHQDRRFELRRLGRDGNYTVVNADGGGSATSATLPVTFTTVVGPWLRIDWADGSVEV